MSRKQVLYIIKQAGWVLFLVFAWLFFSGKGQIPHNKYHDFAFFALLLIMNGITALVILLAVCNARFRVRQFLSNFTPYFGSTVCCIAIVLLVLITQKT